MSEHKLLDPTQAMFSETEQVEALGRTHFIGIGGAGMSVLAEMLHEQGVAVDGSDSVQSEKTERLESLGIPVAIGQDAHNVTGVNTVVYSSAIKEDNPEIIEAAAHNIRIVHRSDILSLLMQGKRTVTVAGAHGKTTTSSMLAHIVARCGCDPSFAIGGTIQSPQGAPIDGGHAGSGDILIAEADESDGSFKKYRPDIAIITNVQADHLDHYGTEEHYQQAFVEHAKHAKHRVIMCIDDEGSLRVLSQLPSDVRAHTVVYGTQPQECYPDLLGATFVQISSEEEHENTGAESFTINLPQSIDSPIQEVPVVLSVPGLHNARNATAAILAAIFLGIPVQDAVHAAFSFLGASRRFEIRGTIDGVTVVDDYAHHPTEIAALIDAARRRYPTSTLRLVFQPHLYSRTQFFATEFAQALSKADDVIVTGIFPARERQEDYPNVHAQTIVEKALHNSEHPWICAVEDMNLAAKMMAMRAHSGDVIITVGAGDITQVDPVILHSLQAHAEDKAR